MSHEPIISRGEPLHSLRIRELRLDVRLGCSAEERRVPQEVRVSVELRFARPPAGGITDELGDTICYASLCEALRSYARGREFHLVEKMAADFLELLQAALQGRAEVAVSVHKVSPPIDGLLGGVEYRIGAFP